MAITPYLLYQDAGAAVAWLTKAFGLRPSGTVYRDDAGRVTHAEMKLGSALLLLGSPGADFRNPKALGHATHNLYVDVDNVDEHHARALRAGATIIERPTDTFYGARRYGAEDPEGHRWYFAQALTKVVGRPRKRKASGKALARRATKRRRGKPVAKK
jgi:uncharacterized glyoxalase superfamily protein PhnB